MAVKITARHMEGGADHEHIAQLWWVNDTGEGSGIATRDEVVAFIDANGENSVWCPSGEQNTKGAWVRTNGNGRVRFVQAFADNCWTNNLLSLPDGGHVLASSNPQHNGAAGSHTSIEHNDIGAHAIVNTGTITVGEPREPRYELPIRDTFTFTLPVHAGWLRLAGAMAAIVAFLANAATFIAFFPSAWPIVKTVANFNHPTITFFFIPIGLLLLVIGVKLKSQEHSQLRGWTLQDCPNGLEVSRKVAPCPLCPEGRGTMDLTTMPRYGDTPVLVCRRNPAHVIRYDY